MPRVMKRWAKTNNSAGVPLAACPPVWGQRMLTALADELPVAPARLAGLPHVTEKFLGVNGP